MNRAFEERKQELLDYLKEAYQEEKPEKWWHCRKPVYKTTWDFANTKHDYQRDDYNVIIRKNKKEAASLVAFLFLMIAYILYPWNFKEVDPISLFFMGIFLIVAIGELLDRRPKIIIDANGLWTHKWRTILPWNLIVATHIKVDDSGDDTLYELIIHFYDAWDDEFREATYKLGGLEVSNEALAYYIEYWKMETNKNELHFPKNSE